MLTKAEVHERAMLILSKLPHHEIMDDCDHAVLALNKQAALACDLAAEVERLRGVIAEAKAWCEKDVYGEDEGEDDGIEYAQSRILQILKQAEPPKGE